MKEKLNRERKKLMSYTNKELLNSIGLAYGELSLKGKNRGQFEKKLRNKIKKVLEGFEYTLFDDISKPYLFINSEDLEAVTEKMKKVFGIVGLNQAAKVEREDEQIKEKLLQFAEYAYEKGARNFKVVVNRSNKGFEKNSMEYAKELGAHILINSPFEKVKMKDADIIFNVDIRKNVYIYTDKIKTYGGLPLGSTGKGLVLLSGGIDSPVASFMMAKRGMRLNFVTFHSWKKLRNLQKYCRFIQGKLDFIR